jgi:hypothetical protein
MAENRVSVKKSTWAIVEIRRRNPYVRKLFVVKLLNWLTACGKTPGRREAGR